MDVTLIFKCILLGTVQGLTEFLPVSSSGHLFLLQRVLRFEADGAGMTFVSVMLHVGTLLPVLWVFRRDILGLFSRPSELLLLLLATLPAGLTGILLRHAIDGLFSGGEGLLLLAPCFAFTALLLLLAERAANKRRGGRLGGKQAAAMGLMQAAALLPGISRSGSTIAAGTLSGAGREEVARFSFLMSVPVILGSALAEGLDLFLPEAAFSPSPSFIAAMALGTLFSALAGALSVKVTLKAVKRARYRGFSLYLFLLAAVCVWLYAAKIL